MVGDRKLEASEYFEIGHDFRSYSKVANTSTPLTEMIGFSRSSGQVKKKNFINNHKILIDWRLAIGDNQTMSNHQTSKLAMQIYNNHCISQTTRHLNYSYGSTLCRYSFIDYARITR
ncbi:unnamed protein product [Rhizophagus irregularis]|nr:unnamed protein product [Rhizophagus irregularis]